MLFNVGGVNSNPTFFELDAADRLQDGLKSAFNYTLGVLANRWPLLHKIIDHKEEAYGLILLALESHSLFSQEASFGEALYGLRRAQANITGSSKGGVKETKRMNSWQRNVSLFFLVIVPYIKSKIHSVHMQNRSRIQRTPEDMDGSDNESDVFAEYDPESTSNQIIMTARETSALTSLKRTAIKLITISYPYLCTAYEGSSFVYSMMYLLNATPYYSLSLKCAGLVVKRSSAQELAEIAKIASEKRQRFVAGLQGPWLLKAIQSGLLESAFSAMDFAQTGLVASIFIFKMLEWWFQTGEKAIVTQTVFPPPPPPPQPRVPPGGLPLPASCHICPLCQKPRTNPAMVQVSGFCFCYPCIHRYVEQYNQCPVTLTGASVEDIRRLYHNA